MRIAATRGRTTRPAHAACGRRHVHPGSTEHGNPNGDQVTAASPRGSMRTKGGITLVSTALIIETCEIACETSYFCADKPHYVSYVVVQRLSSTPSWRWHRRHVTIHANLMTCQSFRIPLCTGNDSAPVVLFARSSPTDAALQYDQARCAAITGHRVAAVHSVTVTYKQQLRCDAAHFIRLAVCHASVENVVTILDQL
jgi:hypothetical protein